MFWGVIMANFKKEFEIKIVEHISTISEKTDLWPLELNLVSFNGEEPKYDLRRWNKSHTRMGRGTTLTLGELKVLSMSIEDYLEESGL